MPTRSRDPAASGPRAAVTGTVAPGRNAHGAAALGDWIAITPRDAASVTGLERRSLLPGWAWLLLVSGLILTGWLREGRAGKAAPIVPAAPG